MTCSRRTFPTLVRIGIAVLVFGAVLLATGCGKPGNIYGAVAWDGTAYGVVGGFPGSIVPNAYYQVNEGTYEVDYYVYYGGAYWPGGNTSSPTAYWYGYYTVTANKGSILSDGKDSYFQLYLGYDGMYKFGDVRNLAPGQDPTKTPPRLGTQSWTQDGLLITVTNEIRQLTPDQLSKLQSSQLKQK